jgi:tRNA nucleotidyltransferase (CCA-adding enzyme)
MEDVVIKVARLLSAAGGRALLVGGCVRDQLLGFEPKDFDVEVYGLGHDDVIKALSGSFSLNLVGASFGVIKLHNYDIDVALPRRETKLGLGHKAFSAQFDSRLTIKEAAARRDFTINAIYKDPLTGEIIDPWQGRNDLEKKILRHVSGHFAEDPLRVLRAMQFIARFDLEVDESTIGICSLMTSEDLPKERLFEEWVKLLTKGRSISKGLEFLRQVGWLRYYPELEALVGCEQDPQWHPEGDVWCHTKKSLDAYARMRSSNADQQEEIIVALGVLCHDFGKPATTFYDSDKKHIRSPGHDEAGLGPTLSFLSRLTDEERILKEVPALVRLHMRPFALWQAKASDNAIRRLAAEVKRIDRLVKVATADAGATDQMPESCRWLLESAERLKIADSAPKPILMGRNLIELGLKPGVKFGEILRMAYEAQLDGKFSNLDEAVIFAKNFLL